MVIYRIHNSDLKAMRLDQLLQAYRVEVWENRLEVGGRLSSIGIPFLPMIFLCDRCKRGLCG
jgi:hypothetical protein